MAYYVYFQVSFIFSFFHTAWHIPIILFADYTLPGLPKYYAVNMFAFMATGISFAFGWLRLKSGSFWPAALLHASHNLFVQNVFTPLTEQKKITPYIIDEFGVGLAIMGILVAVYFWSKRNQLPSQVETA